MKRTRFTERMLSILLCVALLLTYIPLSALMTTSAVASSAVAEIITDPGTADSWEHMMGTDIDGNRYAGRVWADKSVYKDGDTVKLNSKNDSGSTFEVSLEDDEAFQVIFSVLGSTMSSESTITSSSPMDVVLILDTSTSMDDLSNGVTRLQRVIEAANSLLDDLLTLNNVRIAIVTYNKDSETVLPLAARSNGVNLVVTDYFNNGSSDAGVVTAYDDSGRALGKDSGYTQGTNLQSGIDRGFGILANATDVADRVPVAIVLTDGQANRATQERFYDVINANDKDGTSASGVNLYLSTLLNAAYSKTKVEAHYGREAKVYGIGVDLGTNATAHVLMNPGDAQNGFNAGNSVKSIRDAYEDFEDWAAGQSVTNSGWTFNHNYPTLNGAITRQKIAANINYVDTYYDVSSEKLETTFDQIYQELSSGAFNPISSSSTVNGATGVDNTPLIYVDYIGQYMEVKEIQSITLFGASYGVVKNADGTYTVDRATGTNPTTGERWNTSEDIRISLTKQTDGIQKLEIRINQEILPIIMEHVVSKTVGNVTNATITELTQSPLRVYYTVGVASEILLPNGEVDVTKIQGYSHMDNAAGTVSFYSNQFGVENAATGSAGVINGDAHVGFRPAAENRYYYHQSNQGIFTKITNAETGKTVTISPNEEYGLDWNAGAYELSWMTYEEYQTKGLADTVYTYVTYHRPTPGTTDAANAAEKVTYLVYADWGYLKESAAFYDNNTEKYVNYDATKGFVTADVGVAPAEDQVAGMIAAYKRSNPNAEIYAVLGVGSLRTSRLHNMTVVKTVNATQTAANRYAPEYTHQRAGQHHGNEVVVWLGNNGRITVDVDTGIALTKQVTEAIGNADDTYALTVTVPAGVTARPVVMNASGADVTASISTYIRNTLTVNVKAGETVYISGIPGGTECVIGENIPGTGDYYISSKTDRVTVPTLAQVLVGSAQFAPASVTNAPNKYGNLTVIKDILHHLPTMPESMGQKVFTFKVQLPAALAGETYLVDKTNASAFAEDRVTVGSDGSFTVSLKDNESITVLNLPADTHYTVTEIGTVPGYENTTGSVSGTVVADADNDAHFINTYATTPITPEIIVSGSKILIDEHNTYTADEEFTFVLSRYVEATGAYDTLGTATAKAGERYTFNLAQLLMQPLDLGEYHFRVTETSGSTAGMSYDATRGLFVVKVTDADANGTLEYSVEDVANTTVSGNTVTKDFTNIYDVERTHIDINIQKTLTNDTGVNMPLDLFHFLLVNKANANETYNITTDAAGKATVRVSGLAAGRYEYTLTETDGGIPGMDYDDTAYTVIITVTNNGGELTAVAEIQGAANANGDDTLDVSFENTYSLTEVTHTIDGEKHMADRAPRNDEFQFALYETDSSFVITGDPLDTAKNVGTAFAFDEITYTKVGTYYYSVKELAGNVPGVTYDTTHYHITVTVGIDSEDPARLAVTAVVVNKIGANSDTSGDVVFVNTYKATPTEYVISGQKVLHGRAPGAGEFAFELYEGDVLIETVTNKADGSFAFSAISYTKAGTHTYTVEEVAGNAPGVEYTGVDNPVTVTVTVTDTDSILSAVADISNEEIRFENIYTAQPASIAFNGTKTLAGGDLIDGDFTFKLYSTDHFFDITKDSSQLLATAENEDGAFSFESTLNTTGTHFFVVVEDTSRAVENVVYDGTQHRFAVQVSDVGDGQLRAVIGNVNTVAFTESASSVSVDVAFENAVFEEVAKKEVYLAGNTTTQIDGEQVEAGDILTYFITYTNYTGQDVVAGITDTIPAYTTYVEDSASHNGSYAGTHLNWVLNVSKGESVTVSFQVQVDEAEGTIANTATILDGVNTYYTNQVTNYVEQEPTETIPDEEDIAAKDVFSAEDPTATINGQKVYAGDTLVYAIVYKNTSSEKVTAVITDKIPTHTTYVDGSADNGGVFDDGMITWTLDVEAGESVTVTFAVTVDEVGAVDIKNMATVEVGDNTYTTHEVFNYTEEELPEETIPEETEPEETIPEETEPEETEPEETEPEETEPEETEPEETEPEETEPEETETEETEPEETEPEETEPEETDPEETEPEETEPEETKPEEEPVKPPVSTNPQTGDNTQLRLLFVLLLVSGGGLIMTSLYGRKRKEAR